MTNKGRKENERKEKRGKIGEGKEKEKSGENYKKEN